MRDEIDSCWNEYKTWIDGQFNATSERINNMFHATHAILEGRLLNPIVLANQL